MGLIPLWPIRELYNPTTCLELRRGMWFFIRSGRKPSYDDVRCENVLTAGTGNN
ncbi:hypothetical protein [Lacrimispora sp.]|uniref:hypothetical protein n=1 Tax=Lacrimispora sp. TaxID=2719234 RepID=UPI00286E0651|nr:hypothetical protein [Lacrimispora sp.]